MKRIPKGLLLRMAEKLETPDRDEMAIPSYLHANPLARWLAWRRVEVLAQHLAKTCLVKRSGYRPIIMDYGCGAGVLFDELSHYGERVYAVDRVLDAARVLVGEWELTRIQLLTPQQARKEIPEASVDVIVAGEVLEHVTPLDTTLEFFRSRLRDNGNLLISVPTENVFYKAGRWLAGFKGDYHHSHASSITREILGAGFKEERIEKIPLPGPFALYWVVDYGV